MIIPAFVLGLLIAHIGVQKDNMQHEIDLWVDRTIKDLNLFPVEEYIAPDIKDVSQIQFRDYLVQRGIKKHTADAISYSDPRDTKRRQAMFNADINRIIDDFLKETNK